MGPEISSFKQYSGNTYSRRANIFALASRRSTANLLRVKYLFGGAVSRVFLLLQLGFVFICCLDAVEIGQFTALSGEAVISRNREPHFQPVIASRVYTNDIITLDEMSLAVIETPQNIWQITGPAKVTVTEQGFLEKEYGVLTRRRLRSRAKKLPLALGYTLAFPGWGHWYIEDRLKAWPMFAASSWLLWNILNNNPAYSSDPEETRQIRQNNQQIYLVYLIVAIIDVWSATSRFNQEARANARIAEGE